MLTRAGVYELSAKLTQATTGSTALVGFQAGIASGVGTVQITVVPGALFAAASTASNDIVRGGVVGEILDFKVTPVDQYGNPAGNDVY